MKKRLLNLYNSTFPCYKINALTQHIEGLPDYLYKETNIVLDIGNALPLPTHIRFYESCFTIEASFNRVRHNVSIPYASLCGLFDCDYNNGIMFTTKMTEEELQDALNDDKSMKALN